MKKETNVLFMEKGNLEECREGSLDQFSDHVGAENGRRYVCKKKKNVIQNLTYCCIGRVVHIGLNL